MSPLPGPGDLFHVVEAPWAMSLPWRALGPHVPVPPPCLTLSLPSSQLLALGVSITEAPQPPRTGASSEDTCSSHRQGAACVQHRARVSHQLQNTVPPFIALQPLSQGLLKKCGRRWRFAGQTPPCSVRAGSAEDAPPVPATHFACDKAWPCQEQWPSLQPASRG